MYHGCVGKVDYDRLASGYDRRYRLNPLAGVEGALARLVTKSRPALALEVGCGSGRWLPVLAGESRKGDSPSGESGTAVGVDPSIGMLSQARAGRPRGPLVCADGAALPFGPATFDLIAAINALHHIDDPARFVRRCASLLRPGGGLGFVHYDPARAGQSWYVYDVFEGTLRGDRERFPREERILAWMRDAGLQSVTAEVAETIERRYSGREVLDDYFLDKASNSTLAGLSKAAWEAGMEVLRRRLDEAEARGEAARFDVCLEMRLLSGRKP